MVGYHALHEFIHILLSRYATGDAYEGDFVAGMQHGRGKHTSALGSIFEGQCG